MGDVGVTLSPMKATVLRKTRTEPRISCRAPRKLKKRIAAAAKIAGISDSDFVRMAVNAYLPVVESKAVSETQKEAA